MLTSKLFLWKWVVVWWAMLVLQLVDILVVFGSPATILGRSRCSWACVHVLARVSVMGHKEWGCPSHPQPSCTLPERRSRIE